MSGPFFIKLPSAFPGKNLHHSALKTAPQSLVAFLCLIQLFKNLPSSFFFLLLIFYQISFLLTPTCNNIFNFNCVWNVSILFSSFRNSFWNFQVWSIKSPTNTYIIFCTLFVVLRPKVVETRVVHEREHIFIFMLRSAYCGVWLYCMLNIFS